MDLPAEVVDDVIKRLHRVGGQIKALERMLTEGRDCRDLVTQFSAASKALDQAGFRVVAAGLNYCTQHPEEAAADGYAVDDVERLFLKLS
jgi:DNA-binding FrmR family transcriptional regulator